MSKNIVTTNGVIGDFQGDATARTLLERDASWNAQLRELATVRPYGMTQTAVTVWQLTTSDRRASESERLAEFDGLNYRA